MDVEKDIFEMSNDDRDFFKEFADNLFDQRSNIEDIMRIIKKQSRKLIIDFMMFFTHSRVNRYASNYIVPNELNQTITSFREEFKDLIGKYESKLSKKEKYDYNIYWSEKELIRTTIFFLIFTIDNSLRDIRKMEKTHHALNLVAISDFEKKYGKRIGEFFLYLYTFGDVFDLYSRIYLNDFEYLFGNFVEPVFSKVNQTIEKKRFFWNKQRKYFSRHQKIEELRKYSKREYSDVFDAMNSSLRNAFAHRIYYVNKEKLTLKYENHRKRIVKMTLKELDDLVFRQRSISYIFMASDEFLSLKNNLAIKIIKSFLHSYVTNPRQFSIEFNLFFNVLVNEFFLELNKPIISLILSLSKEFLKDLLTIFFLSCANTAGLEYLNDFVVIANRLHISVNKKPTKKVINTFFSEIKDSFRRVDIEIEDKDTAEKYKRFIRLIILNFINQYGKDATLLKELYLQL